MRLELKHLEANFPDFLIVGAAKSGTSSLHAYLNQNPDIFLPENQKELWFWHQNRNKNQAIYNYWDRSKIPQNIFEYLEYFNNARSGQLTGEVCPSYLYYHKETIESLKELHPKWREVKIIIILRNPTDRILSEYRFVRQHGLDPENLDLDSALNKESERKKNPHLLLDLHYRSLSAYYHQVEDYLNNFPNVHICLYDDLRLNAEDLLQNIYEFLGVNTAFKTDTRKIFNASKPVQVKKSSLSDYLFKKLKIISKSFPDTVRRSGSNAISNILYRDEEMPIELVKSLRVEFIGEIQMLEKMIQRDLSAWKVVENEPTVM